MRNMILATMFVLYAIGAGAVYAKAGCSLACGTGYSHDSETGTCVPVAERA